MADVRQSRKQYFGEVFSASLTGRGGEGHATGQQMRSSVLSKMKACTNCGTTSTPQWREGPLGPRTLCNACGVKRVRHLNKLRDAQHQQGGPALKISRTQASSRTSTPPSSWHSSPAPPPPADLPKPSLTSSTFRTSNGSETTTSTHAASRGSGTSAPSTSAPLCCFADEELEDMPLLTPAQSAALLAPAMSEELLPATQPSELMARAQSIELLGRARSTELLGSRSPSSAGSAQPEYHMDLELHQVTDLEEPSFPSHFNLDALDCHLHAPHQEPALGMDISHREPALGMDIRPRGPALCMETLQGEPALCMNRSDSCLLMSPVTSPDFDQAERVKQAADAAHILLGEGQISDPANAAGVADRDEAAVRLEEQCRAAGVCMRELQPQQLAQLQELWQQAECTRQVVAGATASLASATQQLAEVQEAASRSSSTAAQAAQQLYDMAVQLQRDFNFEQLLAATRAPGACPAAASSLASAAANQALATPEVHAAGGAAEGGSAAVSGAIDAVAAAASDAVGVDDPELKAMLHALMQDALAKLTASTHSKAAGPRGAGLLQAGCMGVGSGAVGGTGGVRWQEYVSECDLQLADQLIMAAATEAASAMAAMLPPEEFLALAEAAAS